MEPRGCTWALALLGAGLALALALAQGGAAAPGAPEKLCGHHFVRALVRVCGGPRWSPEDGRPVAGGDREWGRARTAPWGPRVRWGRARGRARATGWRRGCVRARGGCGRAQKWVPGERGGLASAPSGRAFIFNFRILIFMNF